MIKIAQTCNISLETVSIGRNIHTVVTWQFISHNYHTCWRKTEFKRFNTVRFHNHFISSEHRTLTLILEYDDRKTNTLGHWFSKDAREHI